MRSHTQEQDVNNNLHFHGKDIEHALRHLIATPTHLVCGIYIGPLLQQQVDQSEQHEHDGLQQQRLTILQYDIIRNNRIRHGSREVSKQIASVRCQ